MVFVENRSDVGYQNKPKTVNLFAIWAIFGVFWQLLPSPILKSGCPPNSIS